MPDSPLKTPIPSVSRAAGGGRRRGPPDPLGPDSEIGARLRALYAEVEREPIPQDLIGLLERLSEVEKRNKS